MTADPLAEVLAAHIYFAGSDGRGCSCGWLRERGDDRPLQEQWSEKHLAPTVRAFLAEHVAKPEVVEAVASVIDSRTAAPDWYIDHFVPLGWTVEGLGQAWARLSDSARASYRALLDPRATSPGVGDTE